MVYHLLDGIKTDQYNAVKMRIMSDKSLQSDFFHYVFLFKDFIQQNQGNQGATNIKSCPSLLTEREKDKGKEKEPEDHCYKPKEYKKLSQYQQKCLAEMCEAQGNPKPNKHTNKVKKLAKKVTVLAVSFQATHLEVGNANDKTPCTSYSSNDASTMDDQKCSQRNISLSILL